MYELLPTLEVVLGAYPADPDTGRAVEIYVKVPAGFSSDLASVPWWAQRLYPPDDPAYLCAAIVHDYLYRHQIVSRALADAIFRDLITGRRSRAWVMYAAVRLGGRKSYRA